MSWGKLDDSLPTHEKYVNLSQGAKLTCIHAILYASRELTDGKLVQGALNIIFAESDISGPDKAHVRQELLTVLPGHQFGLWEEREGVVWIHDYLQYQPSKQQVLKQRADNKRRVEEFRAKQLAEARNGVGSAITNNVTNRVNNEGANIGTGDVTKPPPSPAKAPSGAGNGVRDAITNAVTNDVTNRVNNEGTNSNVAETPESPIPLKALKTKVKSSSSAADSAERPENTTGLPAAAFSELLSKGCTVEEIQRAKELFEDRPNHPKKVNNWAGYLWPIIKDQRNAIPSQPERSRGDVYAESMAQRGKETVDAVKRRKERDEAQEREIEEEAERARAEARKVSGVHLNPKGD